MASLLDSRRRCVCSGVSWARAVRVTSLSASRRRWSRVSWTRAVRLASFSGSRRRCVCSGVSPARVLLLLDYRLSVDVELVLQSLALVLHSCPLHLRPGDFQLAQRFRENGKCRVNILPVLGDATSALQSTSAFLQGVNVVVGTGHAAGYSPLSSTNLS